MAGSSGPGEKDREGKSIEIGSIVERYCPAEEKYLPTRYKVREFDGMQFRANLPADPDEMTRAWFYPDDVRVVYANVGT